MLIKRMKTSTPEGRDRSAMGRSQNDGPASYWKINVMIYLTFYK